MKRKILLFLCLYFLALTLRAQEEKPEAAFEGYLLYMPSFNITHGFDSILDNHLLHNRLSYKVYPLDNVYFQVDLRNRVFYGDYVDRIPYFKQLVDINNDQLDLSLWLVDGNSVKMLSELDRAYVRFTKKKWDITAGRHRINWGINKIWNPNDIFNPHSFFNFDYQERPASDAVIITYHNNHSSKLEIATKFTDDFEEYTGALLWKVNQKGYDVQLLAGLMENNVVVGTGWSGSINSIGFKGEVSYFSALSVFESDALIASASAEYVFAPEAHILISYYYNSIGVKNTSMEQFALVSSLSYNARNLMPFTSAALIQIAEPISPVFYASMTTIWFPDNGGYFGPGLTYAASDNIKLEFISQMFTAEDQGVFDPASFQIFLRGIWRF